MAPGRRLRKNFETGEACNHIGEAVFISAKLAVTMYIQFSEGFSHHSTPNSTSPSYVANEAVLVPSTGEHVDLVVV